MAKKFFILGRSVRLAPLGLEYKADPKHRTKVLDHFVFSKSRAVFRNGEKEHRKESDWDKTLLDPKEAMIFCGSSARFNILSQAGLDLQFLVKELSRDMANPKNGCLRDDHHGSNVPEARATVSPTW